MAAEALDRPQQWPNLMLFSDRREMRDLRHGQRILEPVGQVDLRPTGRHCIAEDTSEHAAQAASRFISASGFHAAQHEQEIGRLKATDPPLADDGIGKAEQPLDLAQRDIRQTFTFPLYKPLLSHRFESGSVADLGAHFELSFENRIEPHGQSATRIPVPLASLAHADLREDTEGHGLMLALEAIIVSPVSRAIGRHEQVQAMAVRKLILLLAGFGFADG
jgi:hypothetical protein